MKKETKKENGIKIGNPTLQVVNFTDYNGEPLAGGRLYLYTKTRKQKPAYADNSCTIRMPNPIILDAHGRAMFYTCGMVYISVMDFDGKLLLETSFHKIKTINASVGEKPKESLKEKSFFQKLKEFFGV